MELIGWHHYFAACLLPYGLVSPSYVRSWLQIRGGLQECGLQIPSSSSIARYIPSPWTHGMRTG